MNIQEIKNWLDGNQVSLIGRSDSDFFAEYSAPGEFMDIRLVDVPAAIYEEHIVETFGDDMRKNAQGDVYLCERETDASITARRAAQIHNSIASVVTERVGVFFLPVTDGEGQAWWQPVNEISACFYISAPDGSYRNPVQATNLDEVDCIIKQFASRGIERIYAGYAPAITVNCDWFYGGVK